MNNKYPKKILSLLTIGLVIISAVPNLAFAHILFQDDQFATVLSDNIQIGSNDMGAKNTGIQFGADGSPLQNGNITYDITSRSFNIDHPATITNTGSGNSFLVNNAENPLKPFVITKDGDVGIGTTDLGYPSFPTKVNIEADPDQNSTITSSGNINDFLQSNVHNRNSGANASSDSVATNDIGDNSNYYVDMGINSSGYSNPAYSITGPNDSYLYSNGGNLAVGTQTPGTSLIFHTSGTTAADEKMRIDDTGNVGINTTTPGSKLDVKGDLHLSGATSGYVGLIAPAVAGSTTYTLPSADGPVGDVLTTDGSGILSWSDRYGKFQRVGTTVSPNFAGDDITTSGNIYTSGSGQITSAGLLTGSSGLSISGAAADINANSNNDTNINTGTSTGNVNIGNSAAGTLNFNSGSLATFQTGNSTLQIDSSSITLQPAGTGTTGTVQIGAGQPGSTTPDVFILDSKSDNGDPAGVDGAMYYNEFNNKFRCHVNGSWADCDTTGGTTTLQSAYDSGASISTHVSTPIHFDLASGDFNVDGTGAVNLTPTAASQFTSGGALTLTGGAASAWGTSAGNLRLYANNSGTGNVQIGTGSATATPDMLVLDQGSVAPTGTNGAMYYNTVLNAFRCYVNGGWQDCGATAASETTLQQAYTAGNIISLASGDFTIKDSTATNTLFDIADGGAATLSPAGAINLTAGAASTFKTTSGDLTLEAANGGTGNVQIGAGGAGSATPNLFGVDVKSTSGDPTGYAGAMYYNTTAHGGDGRFRCYESGAWKDCDAGVVASYQTAYNNGGTMSTSGGNPVTFNLTDGAFNINGPGTATFNTTVNMPGLTASKPVFTDASDNLTSSGTVPLNQGGTGQTTKTAAFNALSPNTTKGDISVFNGTDNVRLPVGGTNGFVLSVDSTQATGVRWVAPNTGTVTSVSGSGGTTGMTLGGGPITSSGTLTLSGTLNVANGGTGSTTASGARTNLGAAASGANSDITSLSGLSTALSVGQGGTGQTSYTNGQLLIGNSTGNTLTKATLTGTTNQINITNGAGSITLSTPQNINTGASPTFAGMNLSGLTVSKGVFTDASDNLTSTGTLGVSQGGTGLTTGTSGGVLGFTAAGTLASSGVLAANQLMLGGGAGATPSTLGFLGTATTVLHGNAGGAPTFGAVDLASDITGTLGVSNGGTGQTTITGALNALLPSQTGNAGKVLTTDGSNTSWTSTGGTGTVTSVNASGGTTGLTFSGGPITASGTLTLSGTLALANGGTNNTLTASNGGIVYSDASKLNILSGTATAGKVLQSGASSAPTWSTPTYPSASGTAGKILRSDGTNNVYSTSTFADTYATNNLLFSNGANTVQGLATANNGVLVTSASGVPSISTNLPAGITITGGSGSAMPILGGTLSVNGTAVGNTADTSEDNLMTYSLPANTLTSNNSGIRVRAWGDTASNSNSKTIRLYFGSTLLVSIAANANNKPWFFDAYILRSGATTQVAMGQAHFNADTSITVGSTTPAETLSGAVTVKVTGQTGTANANNIVQKGFVIEYLGD